VSAENEAEFESFIRLGGLVSDVSFDLDPSGNGKMWVTALPYGVRIGEVLQRRSRTLISSYSPGTGPDGRTSEWCFVGSGHLIGRGSMWVHSLDRVRELITTMALGWGLSK